MPFFPRVQLKAAEVWNRSGDKSKALKDAAELYHGGKQTVSQNYEEVALVFGRSGEDPTDSELFWHLTETLTAPLPASILPAES